jgi:hypothetical protein
MTDPTETFRRAAISVINSGIESNDERDERKRLEGAYGVGNVWSIDELTGVFEINSFLAPFCSAVRKADGVKGILMFQHSPRFYFDFRENE